MTWGKIKAVIARLQVFVSSGLGGMSGAQAKAAVICGCVGVFAEVGPVTSSRGLYVVLNGSVPLTQLYQAYLPKVNP